MAAAVVVLTTTTTTGSSLFFFLPVCFLEVVFSLHCRAVSPWSSSSIPSTFSALSVSGRTKKSVHHRSGMASGTLVDIVGWMGGDVVYVALFGMGDEHSEM